MLLFSLFRVGGFIFNAALIFLLMPREPRLDWTEGRPSVWQRTRETVFRRLDRVRSDLDQADNMRERIPRKLFVVRIEETRDNRLSAGEQQQRRVRFLRSRDRYKP